MQRYRSCGNCWIMVLMLKDPPTQKFVLAEQIWEEEEDGKTAELFRSLLLKTGRKPVLAV